MINIYFYLASIIIIAISAFVIAKKDSFMTFPMTISIHSFVSILSILFAKQIGEFINSDSSAQAIPGIISSILFYFSILCYLSSLFFLFWRYRNYKEYDFKDRILSLSYFWNKISNRINKKNSFRIIGSIFPFNESQIVYNGKNIVTEQIPSLGHTMIQGSTGSGKTYAMKQMIKQDIASGRSVIFGDFKGDPDLFNEVIDFAKKYKYEVYFIKPKTGENNFNYDPMQNINAVGIIEALLNMRKWSVSGNDGYFKQGMQILLQKMVTGFDEAYKYTIENEPSENLINSDGVNIYEIWDKYVYNFKTKINNYGIEVPIEPKFKTTKRPYLYAFYRYALDYKYGSGEGDAYYNVVKSIEMLMTSSLGNMFTFKDENQKTLDFEEIKNDKFLCIFSFVSANKELATSFTSLLLRDILDSFTASKPKVPIMAYFDEFATLTNPYIIKDALEKGRSAFISLTLALQDVNQIVIETNEAYLNSILGIMNTFLIFNGATKDSAEKISGVQISNIETLLMNLRKPIDGESSTALYIGKYPYIKKRATSEVFRFVPYIYKDSENNADEKNNKRGKDSKVDNMKNIEDKAVFDSSDEEFENDLAGIDEILERNDNNVDIKNVDIKNVDEKVVDYNDFI